MTTSTKTYEELVRQIELDGENDFPLNDFDNFFLKEPDEGLSSRGYYRVEIASEEIKARFEEEMGIDSESMPIIFKLAVDVAPGVKKMETYYFKGLKMSDVVMKIVRKTNNEGTTTTTCEALRLGDSYLQEFNKAEMEFRKSGETFVVLL